MRNFIPALILFSLAVAMPADSQDLPAPVYSISTATSATTSPNPTTGQDGGIPLDLSATAAITVCSWMYWTDPPGWAAGTNNDLLALEFGAPPFGFSSVTGGIIWDPQSSQAGGGQMQVGSLGNIGYNQVSFARPTANAWHHYCFVMDNTQPADGQVVPWIDGQAITFTKTNPSTNAANSNHWAKATLYFFSRAGASLVGPGTFSSFGIYPVALTAAQIAGLANSDKPTVGGNGPGPTTIPTPTPDPGTTTPVVPVHKPDPGTEAGTTVVLPLGQNVGDVLTATWEMMSQPGAAANGYQWYFQAAPAPVAKPLPVQCNSGGLMCSGAGTDDSPILIQTDPAVVQWRVAVPSTSVDTCVQGSYAVDVNFRYECVAANTWMRIPMSHW